MLMTPYHGYGYLGPTIVRIGFGVTGLQLGGVMSMVQDYCTVRCWKPVVSYHPQI
jgi:hypothetical protein